VAAAQRARHRAAPRNALSTCPESPEPTASSRHRSPAVLVINKSQMGALGQAARRRFEDRMVEHFGEFAPALARAAGEEHLRKAIHLGISRAGSYGLTHQGPVRLYLELMLLFGSDFDTDPPQACGSLPKPERASPGHARTDAGSAEKGNALMSSGGKPTHPNSQPADATPCDGTTVCLGGPCQRPSSAPPLLPSPSSRPLFRLCAPSPMEME
jgi:hypothetical protein